MNPELNQSTQDGLTVLEFSELMGEKADWDNTAKGFNTVITKENLKPFAENLIDEMVGEESPIAFFKNTRPIKERAYYNYAFARGRG